MTSLNPVDNCDDITSADETSGLLVQPRQTSSYVIHNAPRHSISWVDFLVKLFKITHRIKFIFRRIFLVVGVKLLELICLSILMVQSHQQQR